jgi:transposase
MPNYKPNSTSQGIFAPVHLSHQIQPCTFEYTLNHLVENVLDLSILDSRFKNDETGAPAYAPKILLKIVLFAYSRGIMTSRKIARACVENMVFVALSANSKPHYTTIANFISSIDNATLILFRNILLVCDENGLIGKEMFAVDGCKISSNASKEWSGTISELKKKAEKMEKAVELLVNRHYKADANGTEEEMKQRDEQYIETLNKRIDKIHGWLAENVDRPGKNGKPVKSNITDNDSAKMKTSKGVIQGYNGIATADSKHQIVVHAEAFGQGPEHDLLEPTLEGIEDTFSAMDVPDILRGVRLTADSGSHTEANMKMLYMKQIDAYVADNQMRKRDPRFADYGRYKERHRKERAAFEGRSGEFKVDDFFFPDDLSYCICPAGQRIRLGARNVDINTHKATKFKGPKSSCMPCKLRSQCLRKPEKTEVRQVAFFHGRSEKGKNTFTEKMKRKIDSVIGRYFYSKRLGTIEPVFGNICSTIGLNRFTLRGKTKVNSQWLMYCMTHNIKKIHQFAPDFT